MNYSIGDLVEINRDNEFFDDGLIQYIGPDGTVLVLEDDGILTITHVKHLTLLKPAQQPQEVVGG